MAGAGDEYYYGGPGPRGAPHGLLLAVVVGLVVAGPLFLGDGGEVLTEAVAELLSPVVLGGLTGLGNPFWSLVEYFQHMFPAVDPSTVKLATCQRILLLKHDKEKMLLNSGITPSSSSLLVSVTGLESSCKTIKCLI